MKDINLYLLKQDLDDLNKKYNIKLYREDTNKLEILNQKFYLDSNTKNDSNKFGYRDVRDYLNSVNGAVLSLDLLRRIIQVRLDQHGVMYASPVEFEVTKSLSVSSSGQFHSKVYSSYGSERVNLLKRAGLFNVKILSSIASNKGVIFIGEDSSSWQDFVSTVRNTDWIGDCIVDSVLFRMTKESPLKYKSLLNQFIILEDRSAVKQLIINAVKHELEGES